MNQETSSSNPSRKRNDRVYDLEVRLLNYAVQIILLVEQLPATRAGNHIAMQLLKSGTSPLPNHGEAQAAESRRDFVHKLKIVLKELRESRRWLLLIRQVPLLTVSLVTTLICEIEELIRIFVVSIRTAEKGRDKTRASNIEPMSP